MADIFLPYVNCLYNGGEANRPGFGNAYPPKFSTPDSTPVSIVAPSATQSKFGGVSVRFTGATAGFVYSPLHIGTTADQPDVITMEAWVRPDAVTGNQGLMCVREVTDANVDPDAATSSQTWSLLLVGAALALHQGNVDAASLPAGTLTAATWYHVRWTVNAANVHVVYLDGTEVLRYVGQGTSTQAKLYQGIAFSAILGTGAFATAFGSAPSGSTYPGVVKFTGYMDDLRVTRAVRNSANFTAPTSAFDLTSASVAQGVGAAAGTGAADAPATARSLRQGDGSAAGLGAATASGGRSVASAFSAAGTSTASADSDNDANPPTFSATTAFATTWLGDVTSDVSVTSTWATAATQDGQTVRDGALSAAYVLAPSWTSQQELSAELFALVRMLGALPQQNERGLAWVVNTITGGCSLYEGFDFNSFGKLDTAYIGCKSDGIYVLDGEDDNGSPIQASVSFGKTDMGSPHLQRMIKAYADIASTGPMAMKITTGADEFIYAARDFDEALTTQRFDIGRGLEARYFTFEIFNTDGCDFAMSSATFLTNDVMHRRI